MDQTALDDKSRAFVLRAKKWQEDKVLARVTWEQLEQLEALSAARGFYPPRPRWEVQWIITEWFERGAAIPEEADDIPVEADGMSWFWLQPTRSEREAIGAAVRSSSRFGGSASCLIRAMIDAALCRGRA